jgi:PCRF domain
MIEELVERIEERFAQLEADLADPEVIGDRAAFEKASRAYSELEEPARLAREWRRAHGDQQGAREMLADGEDPELRQMEADATATLEGLEDDLRLAMVEKDPNDSRDVIIEIRAGAGGVTFTGCCLGTQSGADSRSRTWTQVKAARPSPSRVRAPIQCSSLKPEPTGFSEFQRRSLRAESTLRQRRSQCCLRLKRLMSRST